MSLLDGQFLTMTLEDGEKVVRLRGGRGQSRNSDRPHAGMWGPETAYVLVPCRSSRQVTLRLSRAVSSEPGLADRSGEDAVLVLGDPEAVERLLLLGPSFCRALVSRKGQPRSEAQQAVAAKLRSKP